MFRLRPLTPADLPLVRDLMVAQWEVALAGPELATLVDIQVRAQEASYRSRYPDAEYLVIEQEGRAVGRLYRKIGDVVHVIDISLLPEARGAGVGTAVLRQTLSDAAEAGRPVTLTVAATNPARRLYERLGFVEDGEDGPHVHYRWTPEAASVAAPVDALPTADEFDALLQQPFPLVLDGTPLLELTLVEVRRIGWPGPAPRGPDGRPFRDPFGLLFRGPLVPALPQRTYTLRHPARGDMRFFLVPVAQEADGMRYDCVFS
jgi:GNAT superfamily N-acetyltransferase